MTAGCRPRAQRLADWEISWPGRCRTRRPEPVVPGGTTEGEQRRAHRAAARAEPARLRRRAVAVDGKCLRGARRPDGSRVFILSAVRHGDGVTLASHTAAPGQLQGEDGRGAPRLGADPPAREGQAGHGRPEAVREPVVLYRWRWALRATLSLCGCSGTTTGWPVPMDTVGQVPVRCEKSVSARTTGLAGGGGANAGPDPWSMGRDPASASPWRSVSEAPRTFTLAKILPHEPLIVNTERSAPTVDGRR